MEVVMILKIHKLEVNVVVPTEEVLVDQLMVVG